MFRILFFQAEDGIRYLVRSRGLGDVYKRQLLRRLVLTRVPGITTEDQVRFQPPDQIWRTYVNGLGARNALNIYLFDLRENRKLRSNERVRSTDSGVAFDTPAAPRADCHYPVSYTHLRAHETVLDIVCRLLLEKKHVYIIRSTHCVYRA